MMGPAVQVDARTEGSGRGGPLDVRDRGDRARRRRPSESSREVPFDGSSPRNPARIL